MGDEMAGRDWIALLSTIALTVLVMALVVASASVAANDLHSAGHSRPSGPPSEIYPARNYIHGRHKAEYVTRDSRGKIARSSKAKGQFRHSHPCPSTGKTSGVCPGYVIDHVLALKRGGADSPRNMQWQTTQAARLKDGFE